MTPTEVHDALVALKEDLHQGIESLHKHRPDIANSLPAMDAFVGLISGLALGRLNALISDAQDKLK